MCCYVQVLRQGVQCAFSWDRVAVPDVCAYEFYSSKDCGRTCHSKGIRTVSPECEFSREL